MAMQKNTIACVLILAAAVVPTAHAVDLRPAIDPLARSLLEENTAVGFVIGILKDGQTQVIAYGDTTQGTGIAPNGDTFYEIGSTSKVFTGVLLAEKVEAGVMKLDDPLQQYLPAGVKAPVASDLPITLEHLATHTSGLPRLPDNLKPADPRNPYADYTMEQMYAFLGAHQLRRPPGQYEYSNFGMGLLGNILARQQRTTYEKLLIDGICNPLGMRDTCITLTADQRKRLAPPYAADLKPDRNWDVPTLAGAGAIRSTANDMLKFIQANLANDKTPLTQALRLSHSKRHTMEGGMAVGLAWHIARDGNTRWHNGMTGGYSSWLAVVPGGKVGVVVLANTATMTISTFGEQLTQIALGLPVQPKKPRRTIDVDRAVLDSYVGYYAIVPQFGLQVTAEDGKLMVQATGQEKFQVFAESKTKFFLKVVDAQLTFVPDKDGRVNKVILHQGGRDLEGVRQSDRPKP